MTEEQNEIDKKDKKTKHQIIYFIVIPTLLILAGLIVLDIISFDLVTVQDVLVSTEIKCYNINWFGTEGTGFQVVFKESIDQITSKLKSSGKIIDESFFKEPDVVNYLINACPHLDNRDQIPENYDPTIGVPALDKCIERKKSPELCIELIS